MTRPLTVAVIGGGIMGRGIALTLAGAGNQATIVEPDAATAQRLRAEHEDGGPVAVSGSLEETVTAADLVIEAVPERLDLKREVWARIGGSSRDDAILASNTSALDIDELAAQVPAPHRVLGLHWFNPADVVPCVEVVRAAATSQSAIDTAVAVLRAAGKEPVVVRNSPGFVANRIQFALVREALLCLQEGLASAEEIDRIVRTSFGLRLAVLGPLELADLGGLDTYRSILEHLDVELGERFAPPQVLVDAVDAGRLGTKTLGGLADYTQDSVGALVRRRDDAVQRVLAATREGSTIR